MSDLLQELSGLTVTIDQVLHQPDAQTPPDRPNCFAYFISIHNHSDVTVTIKGRKWVVRDEDGDTIALEGDGVVGQFAKNEPGGKFSDNSYHVFDTNSAVTEGSYLGITEDGRKVFTRIPRFEMQVPNS